MPDQSRVFRAAVVVLALCWLPAGCCCLPVGKSRDPKFDQVKNGMSEEAVLKLLGTPYTYQPHAAGVWLYPRMTLEELHEDPSRNLETRDVILIYFRDGKVDNTYRRTGEEFRQPRPRRPGEITSPAAPGD
jgi:outer membrane protein assembly factor BamE (lipoprotein component of BamABCDE complex)